MVHSQDTHITLRAMVGPRRFIIQASLAVLRVLMLLLFIIIVKDFLLAL